ncbi:peptidyl-prolyl cis-trans isomerase FKBP19, chloroplastic [Artemisia annua]|uniref:Peptidyl-prolyl cis-trans isomerase FKBP19, chloroplastic n=1 Tax=Artemisia annua TaxID=35608 RepID=A0A2U1KHE7_ARTAN|nr:peptidyl-prolyl cis-trans isomerase FKBP19, chloroplastic [Artemisia annua]
MNAGFKTVYATQSLDQGSENHMPDVIFIDESSTRAEVNACQSMVEIKTMKNQARDTNIRLLPLSDLRGGNSPIPKRGDIVVDLRGGNSPIPKRGDIVVVDWDGYIIGYYGPIFEAINKIKGGSFEVIPAFEEAVAGMYLGGIARDPLQNTPTLRRNACTTANMNKLASNCAPENPAPLRRTNSWSFDENLFVQTLYKVLTNTASVMPLTKVKEADPITTAPLRCYNYIWNSSYCIRPSTICICINISFAHGEDKVNGLAKELRKNITLPYRAWFNGKQKIKYEDFADCTIAGIDFNFHGLDWVFVIDTGLFVLEFALVEFPLQHVRQMVLSGYGILLFNLYQQKVGWANSTSPMIHGPLSLKISAAAKICQRCSNRKMFLIPTVAFWSTAVAKRWTKGGCRRRWFFGDGSGKRVVVKGGGFLVAGK